MTISPDDIVFLSRLHNAGGEILVEAADLDSTFDPVVARRCVEAGLAAFSTDGGHLGTKEGFRITRQGREVLGLPRETFAHWLRRLFRPRQGGQG